MQKLLLMILARRLASLKKSLDAFAQRTNSIAGGNPTGSEANQRILTLLPWRTAI
jgi:hypothetical protein